MKTISRLTILAIIDLTLAAEEPEQPMKNRVLKCSPKVSALPFVFGLLLATSTWAQTTATSDPVGFAAGGGISSVGNYVLNHTVGEPIVGDSSVGGYTLGAGFWAHDDDAATGGTPPTVALTAPAGGSLLAAGAAVTLSATAAAANGNSIISVQFLDGSNVVGQVTASPYSLALINLSAGVHSLTARATDSAGMSATSEVVSIQVFDPTSISAGGVDLSFAAGGSINDAVLTIVGQPDGKTVIAGVFISVNGAPRGRLARLDRWGRTDFSFADPEVNDKITCIARQPDGKFIIGGFFTKVHGITRNKIARINTDGSLDRTFGEGLSGADGGFVPIVNAVAIQEDGKIVLGGGFNDVNGVARQNLARLNTNGTTDLGFMDAHPNGEVVGLSIHPGSGKISFGGYFNTVAGISRIRIARVSSDGSLDRSFQENMGGANNTVNSVVALSDGSVLVAGGFGIFNGMARSQLVRLTDTGELDSFHSSGFINPSVGTVVRRDDGKVLIAGSFTGADGSNRPSIARYTDSGVLDSFMSGRQGPNNWIGALLPLSDNSTIVAGHFTSFNGQPYVRIAKIDDNGNLDPNWGHGSPGFNGLVRSVTVTPEDKITVGGDFTFLNYTAAKGLARLNSNGSFDTTFAYGSNGPNSSVYSMALQPGGKTLIAGPFNLVNGISRNCIARLDANGFLDPTFGYNGSGSSGIQVVALQPDGKALVAGSFNALNGTSSKNVGRLTSNGLFDSSFNVGTGPNGLVTSLTVRRDGSIDVGGWFSTVAGVTRNGIARLRSDGTLDSVYPSPGANNRIWALALQADDKTVVVGDFTQFGGAARNCIARMNADGSVDSSFGNGLSLANGGPILAVRVQSNGEILIGGDFSAVNGTPRNRIARLKSNGQLDPDFANGSGANGTVWAIDLDRQGNVIIGGAFTVVEGYSCDRIARLSGGTPDATPPVIACPGSISAQASGAVGAVVNFTVTAVDSRDPAPIIVCTPPSGTLFAIGTTVVSCVATDASGNASSCTFSVAVSGLVVNGREHVPLGNTMLSLGSDGLRISNLSTCGQDGVTMDLHELSRTASLNFGSNGFTLPGLGKLAIAAYGTVSGTPNQFLGSVTLAHSNGVLNGFWENPDAHWFQSRRIEVYNGAALVATYPVPEDGTIGTFSGDAHFTQVNFIAEPGQDAFWCWDGWWWFSPPGQPSTILTATEVRLVYVGSAGKIDNLASLVVGGCGIPSLLIQEESAPQFQPRLDIEPSGQYINLTWDTRSSVLECAISVNGPWQVIGEGVNSLKVIPTGSNAFYRVRTKFVDPPLWTGTPRVGVNFFLIGSNMGPISFQTPAEVVSDLKALGARAMRQMPLQDVGWPTLYDPATGLLDFTHSDELFAALDSTDIRPILTLFQIGADDPSAFCADTICDPAGSEVTLSNPYPAYDYVAQVAAKYGGKNACFEVLNEMVLQYPDYTAEDYAQLLVISRTALDSVDPNLKLVLGGLVGDPGLIDYELEWLTDVVNYLNDNGYVPTDYLDVMNFHFYYNWHALARTITPIKNWMTVNGFDIPIWLTEVGYSHVDLADAIAETHLHHHDDSEEVQAAELFRLFSVAFGNGVELANWHSFLCSGEATNSSAGWDGFGLRHANGSNALAWWSYQLFAHELGSFYRCTPVSEGTDGVWAYRFATGSAPWRYKWVMWTETNTFDYPLGNLTGSTSTFTVNSVVSDSSGVFPSPSSASGSMTWTVGTTPVLIKEEDAWHFTP